MFQLISQKEYQKLITQLYKSIGKVQMEKAIDSLSDTWSLNSRPVFKFVNQFNKNTHDRLIYYNEVNYTALMKPK